MAGIAADWRTAGLDPQNAALCAFAEKLTRSPQAMSEEDLAPLRRQGLEDRAIHDAVQVIGYFNYINRVADALGIDEEAWLRPWEREGPATRPGDR